jgi:hypothetical protein
MGSKTAVIHDAAAAAAGREHALASAHARGDADVDVHADAELTDRRRGVETSALHDAAAD